MYVFQMSQINENNKYDHESIINLIPINEVETDDNIEENDQIESSKDIENI